MRNENKFERIHKDRRKYYDVFHEWNQSKCANTGRARCRSCAKEYITEKIQANHMMKDY